MTELFNRLSARPQLSEETPFRLLLVEDDDGMRASIRRWAVHRGIICESFPDPGEALVALPIFRPDVVLTDYRLPTMDGLAFLGKVHEYDPEIPVVLMTAQGNFELAVNALRSGAFDLLAKPFDSPEIAVLQLVRAARQRRLLVKNRMLEREVAEHVRFGELVGDSPAMRQVYEFVSKISITDSPVLILGESGTGKELVARAIHNGSKRKSARLVSVNCAAIPSTLVESELFGHVKGAFTGALSARPGLFESAHEATIFLDELAELPLPTQARLLRTLQNGEIRRVGSDQAATVDVRVLAATNGNIEEMIRAGHFRQDLYYRLNVFSLHLPPLRERGSDVLLLARYFLDRLRIRTGVTKVLSGEAEAQVLRYHWPGNVRELENAIERAFVFSEGNEIGAEVLPVVAGGEGMGSTGERSAVSVEPPSSDPGEEGSAVERADWPTPEQLAQLPYSDAKRTFLASFDRVYSDIIIEKAGGNLAEAARLAGLDRSNFRRVIRKQRRGQS